MENTRKRAHKQEQVEDELTAKKTKLEEENEEEHGEQQPAVEYLEPHLACEIYAMLPAVHQRRLLTLCRDIYELGPSPDEWTKWRVLNWTGNKWNANDCGSGIELSPEGLAIMHNNQSWDRIGEANTVCAVLGAFPPVITQQQTQYCYFEAKYVGGYFFIGFRRAGVYLHDPMDVPIPKLDRYNILHFGPGFAGRCRLAENHPTGWFRTGDVVGCGMVKHLGKRRIFFTKNGEFLASVPIPSNAPDQLFPAIAVRSNEGPKFTHTNFGLLPFQFNYAGNEEKLLNGLGRDFEKEG